MTKKVCAGGFILDNDKLLFGKRSSKKNWAPGLWDIAGGSALKNENPLYTLRRELKEETGIRVLDAELLSTIDVWDKGLFWFTYHIYMVTAFKGVPVNSSKEHTKLRWFTRKELNEVRLALPVYFELIDAWLKNSSLK